MLKSKKWLLIVLILSFLLPLAPHAAGAAAPTTTFTVLNKAIGPITFELEGPQSYSFVVPANTKVSIDVAKGVYKYSYESCGATLTGKLNIEKPTNFITIKCQVARVTMFNRTPGPMILRLFGPQNYTFTLPKGKTKIEVLPGLYKFIAHTDSCGPNSTGITKRGSKALANGIIWPWRCSVRALR